MTQPAFWQPAGARIQIWRTALGSGLIAAIWLAGLLALFSTIDLGVTLPGLPPRYGLTAAFFASFAGFHIGLILVLAVLHRRGYLTLLGPARRLLPRHFFLGMAATLGVGVALFLLTAIEPLFLPESYALTPYQRTALSAWTLGLAPALALVFVQILAEEAVFRGYLLQQLRARFRSPLIWGVLPALIFGALHFDAATYGIPNALAYVLNATLMGTFAAFITLRTGNLGAAAGLHFGNNATLVLISAEGDLDGFSLFAMSIDPTSGYMTYSILSQTLAMALAFWAWWRWMARHRPIANPARGL